MTKLAGGTAAVLAVAFLLCAGVMVLSEDTAAADPYTADNGVIYTLGETSAAVSGYDKDKLTDGELVIPASIKVDSKDYAVTSIAAYAFKGCTALTSAVIPGSVTDVGNDAFEDCTELTAVVISDGVVKFGNSPFENCSALKSLALPASVTKYSVSTGCSALEAFTVAESNTVYCAVGGVLYSEDMKKLVQCPAAITALAIPNTVLNIGWNAFTDCVKITSLVVPDSVTVIESYAFYNCTGLKTLTLGKNVNYGLDRITLGCTALTAFIVADGNTKYSAEGGVLYSEGMKTLYACPAGLTAVSIASGVTTINAYAFEDSSLASVIIPDGVTTIGGSAFLRCTELDSVILPASVTKIGNLAFPRGFYDAEGNALSTTNDLTEIVGHSYRVGKVGEMKSSGFVQYTGNTVSVTATAGGTVSGGGLYDSGSSVTVTATADYGYTFAGWYDGETKLTNSTSYTFASTGNVSYTAHFNENAAEPSGGSNTWIWIVVVIVVILVVLLAVYFLFIRTGKLKL